MLTQHIKAIFFRHLLPIPRDISRLVEKLYWPFFDILTFGFLGFWVQQQTTGAFALRLIAGLVLWQVVVRAHLEIAYAFIDEIWSNNIATLFSTPLKLTEWFMGVFIISFLNSVFVFLFSTAMVWLLYGVNLFSLGWYLFGIFLTLMLSGWWLSFFTLSIIFWFGRRAESLVWVMGWTLSPLCGVYYPTSILPQWAQKLSTIFPQAHLFKNLDMIIITNQTDPALWYTTMGLTAIFFVVGCLCVRCAFRYSKNLGFANLSGD